MKFRWMILPLISVLAVACTGPAGPAGDAGPGAIYWDYTLQSSDVTTRTRSDGGTYYENRIVDSRIDVLKNQVQIQVYSSTGDYYSNLEYYTIDGNYYADSTTLVAYMHPWFHTGYINFYSQSLNSGKKYRISLTPFSD